MLIGWKIIVIESLCEMVKFSQPAFVCSKLAIKNDHQNDLSDAFIVNFEQISHIVQLLLLFILNK